VKAIFHRVDDIRRAPFHGIREIVENVKNFINGRQTIARIKMFSSSDLIITGISAAADISIYAMLLYQFNKNSSLQLCN